MSWTAEEPSDAMTLTRLPGMQVSTLQRTLISDHIPATHVRGSARKDRVA